MNLPLYHKTYTYYSHISNCPYISSGLYPTKAFISQTLYNNNINWPLYHKTYVIMISTGLYLTKPISWSHTEFTSNINCSPYISTCLYITKPICKTITYQIALKLYLTFILLNLYTATFSYTMWT